MHTQTHEYACLFAWFLEIPDSWLSNSDSLSLLIQSCIPTCNTCVRVYVYICSFVFPWVLGYSWLYLTAGGLILYFSSIQVSLSEQQPVVDPANRRFCRAFIAWVSVRVFRGRVLRYRTWVQVLILCHFSTCICLCFKCFLCECVFWCHGVHRQTNRHSPRKHTHTHTHKYAFFFLVYQHEYYTCVRVYEYICCFYAWLMCLEVSVFGLSTLWACTTAVNNTRTRARM